MKEDLRKKIESIVDFLPPMTTSMNDVVRALREGDVEVKRLSDIISRDPGMSVNVLRVANSAFYGLPNKVTSIHHAVVLLGTKEVASLCIAWGANNALRPKSRERTIDLSAFWRHSVATGIVARILCTDLHLPGDDSFYLAGLVHDVGKVILDRFLHSLYGQVVKLTFDENMPMIEAEKRIVGETHGTVGTWLMKKWRLPDCFAEVARCHHEVMEASDEYRVFVATVALANEIARVKGFGFGGDQTGVVLSETEAFQVLKAIQPGIEEFDIARFVLDLDGTEDEISDIERRMNAS